jgi:uncharacterized protein involved in tolerance to divalent cations
VESDFEESKLLEDFEQELREAFERRPAPPGLKRKIMVERSRQNTARISYRTALLQRLAACLVLSAALAGGYAWRNHQQQLQGEEAHQQVLTALRITNHALDQMKTQLAAHDRDR